MLAVAPRHAEQNLWSRGEVAASLAAECRRVVAAAAELLFELEVVVGAAPDGDKFVAVGSQGRGSTL